MSGKRVVFLIVALLLVVWGVYTLKRTGEDPGDIRAATGPIRVLEGAKDPDFGISVDSPVLIRKVEMYQYVLRGNTVSKDFSETHEPDQTVTEFGSERRLSNPLFPSEPKSKVFCGSAEIGDSGLLLSEELLKTLGFGSYINFSSQPGKLPVAVGDGGKVFGLVPIDDMTYGTGGGDYWEVGDLRVTWYMVDPEDLAEVYTAVGVVQDGVIGDGEHMSALYDREVDRDAAVEEYVTGDRKAGIGLIAVGAVVSVICLLPVFPGKKKSGKQKA